MMLDVLADVDCWHDNIAMIAEEVAMMMMISRLKKDRINRP